MTGLKTCGLYILLCDTALWLAFYAGLVLLKCTSSGGLPGMWAFGALKWALLYCLMWILTDGKPHNVLSRFVALICFLLPAFESIQLFTVGPPPGLQTSGPFTEPSMVGLALVASSVVCAVWEMSFSRHPVMKENKDTPNSGMLLMRVIKYFKPDILYLVAAFTFLILGCICDTFIPYYQGRVIDMLEDISHKTDFFNEIGHLALASIGSLVFSGLRGGVFMWTLCRLNFRMKRVLFHSLLQQDIPFFEENKPGSLSSRLHSDVDRMGRAVALNANVLVRSFVKTTFMLKLMLGLSWDLTLLTCIEVPVSAIVQYMYTKYRQELMNQVQECEAQIKELAFQVVSKITTVRSFNAEKDEAKRYDALMEQMYDIKRRKGIYSAVFLLLRRVITIGIKILMLLRGRSLIYSGNLSIGNLLTFFLYQKPMAVNIREISFGIGEMVSTKGVIAKVFNYVDRKPQCKEAGTLSPDNLEGRITYEDVTFAYPSAPETPVLKSFSIKLNPGEMTAFVGPSGGGKTSLVSLLKRIYEPQAGQILLDGQQLHCYDHKYLHQKIALVAQNPVLFSGSVYYNIQYGLGDCTLNKVKDAARKASAHEFISSMENEYDTDIGECGGKLSAGQKQCIAIARAVVREPQVLILDEATSNLDTDVQNALVKNVLSRGQTVLVVAHQLSTVEKADHIVYIENGAIVEQGTHQELMLKNGRYHRLKEKLFTC